MYNKYIITENLQKINCLKIKENVSLKYYTTFKIGGPVDLFLTPHNKEALGLTLTVLKNNNVPFFVLGSGSNIIVSDNGYRGAVIHLEKLNNIEIKDNIINAECGVSLSSLAEIARKNELKGLEFASGIPGSLGGALFMNAGAYGREMKDVVQNVLTVDYEGNFNTIPAQKLHFSYRKSKFQEENLIAVSTEIKLQKGKIENITEKMKKLNKKRRQKQPLSYPSAGSIFKKPDNDYAGRLIEAAGMKGVSVGGAQVSEKHAGFIINKDKATADDVIKLINKVRKRVYDISGICLEIEPRIIGNDKKGKH